MHYLLESDRIELVKRISLQFIELKQRLTRIKKELYQENLEPNLIAEVEKECKELENMCLSLITNLDYIVKRKDYQIITEYRKAFTV